MVLLTSVLVLGARESTLSQLQRDVAVGDVSTVRMTSGLSDSGRGFATVHVHWRSGFFQSTTQVIEARPLSAVRGNASRDDVTGVVEPGLDDQLMALDPDLRVERGSMSELTGEVLGWRFPSWLSLAVLALTLTTLGLLVLGPQPWRATRWAWFWLLGLGAPLVMVVYLVIGGPTSLGPAPRSTSRRLTGGWAFLITLVVGSGLGFQVWT